MAEVSPCARSLQPRFGGKPQKNVDQVSFTTSPDEVGVVCALQWLSLAGSLGGCVECCLSFAWCLSTAINTTVQSGSLHTCLAVTPDDTQYVVVTMRGSKKFDIVVVGVDCWMTLNRLASPCFRECVCSCLELASLLSD